MRNRSGKTKTWTRTATGLRDVMEKVTREMFWQRRHQEPYRFAALATYNAERSRGLVHTPQWMAVMRKEQALFDAQALEEAERSDSPRVLILDEEEA